MTPRLSRATHGRPAAPVRIVHLGLGNFTRAHQAWYTEHAPDAETWGIAAFTGRRPTMAELLAPQDGLYTLLTKGPDGASAEVIASISEVHPATDLPTLLRLLASPEVAVLTTTVTEAGYHLDADGGLDQSGVVGADLEAVRGAAGDVAALGGLELQTVPVRVAAGLLARRAAGAGAMTVLPCDNLPDNGPTFQRVVLDAARAIDDSLPAWIEEEVSFATCMVDRITPGTSDADREAVRAEGWDDAAPVPTEPFTEWVIAGEFPAGRPRWEDAGAQFVDDVRPYEQRKLWMLNGAHSLLAYAGTILGCETVGDAMASPRARRLVEQWWAEAGPGLEVPWEAYAAALAERFENPGIRHLLAQIAADGSQKLPVRIGPTLRRCRAEGELPVGAATAVAAWMLHLRGHGAPVRDAAEEQVRALVGGTVAEDARRVLGHVAPELAGDDALVAAVVEAAEGLLA